MGDLFFSPAALDVRVGDTITWTNAGRAPHTATSASFDSGRVATGGTFRWTAAAPGTVDYACSIHPEMTGRLRVLAATAAPPPVVTPAVAPTATTTPTTPTTTTAPEPPPAAVEESAPSAADVEVQDFAFAPATVRIAAGGQVTWSFTGAAPHTATGEGFDSGIVDAGATFEHTFEEVGTFAYACAVHPDMQGTVEVVRTELVAATSDPKAAPRGRAPSGGTQAWTVALLGGAGILGGTGALLLGARRFLAAS